MSEDKETESGMFCPLRGSNCRKETCAWYVSENGCAVKVLAEKESLYNVMVENPGSFDKTGWDNK